MTTSKVERDRLQVRQEHKIQKWNVPWYAEWTRFARLSETSRVIVKGRERASKHA